MGPHYGLSAPLCSFKNTRKNRALDKKYPHKKMREAKKKSRCSNLVNSSRHEQLRRLKICKAKKWGESNMQQGAFFPKKHTKNNRRSKNKKIIIAKKPGADKEGLATRHRVV